MQKYVFLPPNSRYKILFLAEAERIRRILPNNTKVEHIGSTAVPGLGGKGIIDIIVAVQRKSIKEAIKLIRGLGYEFKKNAGEKGRLFFIKGYEKKGTKYHIQLTTINSEIWNKALFFRDYLRKNKKVAKAYAQTKKKAVVIAKNEGKIYRKYKKVFIQKIMDKNNKKEI